MQENLLGLVEQAGVVGAGGAGFPTHVKLKAQADTVIINGAECEPLLRVDQQLMALQASDLLDALDLLVEQVGASQGVVALKEHYHAAVEALERELSRHPKLRIHRMGTFYPAGDEQVIVYSRFLLSSSMTSSTSSNLLSWNLFLIFCFTISGFSLKNLMSNISVLLLFSLVCLHNFYFNFCILFI